MSGSSQKSARRERIDVLERQLLAAHNFLHLNPPDIDRAHEALHCGLGSGEQHAEVGARLVKQQSFDHAFIQLCVRTGVRAAYVSILEADETGNARLAAGGDADLCKIIDRAMGARS